MSITVILIVVVVLIVLAGAVAMLKGKAQPPKESAAIDVYSLRGSVFSPAERSFFGVLESLNLEDVTILSKLRLADVFEVKKSVDRSAGQRARNRINAKHVDFLLVDRRDGRPVLGIELDDRSHEENDRVARDNFVDTLFASAGLPILHVPAKAAYDPNQVRREIGARKAMK